MKLIHKYSYLKAWWNSQVKIPGHKCFFYGSFWLLTHIQTQFCSVIILFLHHSIIVFCIFVRIYIFLLGYFIYWCIIVHSSLIIFGAFVISNKINLLLFKILFFGIVSKRVSICLLIQEKFFSYLDHLFYTKSIDFCTY